MKKNTSLRHGGGGGGICSWCAPLQITTLRERRNVEFEIKRWRKVPVLVLCYSSVMEYWLSHRLLLLLAKFGSLLGPVAAAGKLKNLETVALFRVAGV